MAVKNIVGKRFGLITVKSFSHISDRRLAVWDCECDCGNTKKINGNDLRRGSTKSCGCIINKNKVKKWAPVMQDGFLLIPLSKGKFSIIDIEDLPKIEGYSWYCDKKGYARNRHGILMHRVITECPKGMDVDHRDHDSLNNRRINLRICTRSQNQGNKLMTSKNTSGYKGASYSRSKKRYSSTISLGGKQHHLGYYASVEEAHKEYVKKGEILFGEFFNDGNKI